MNCDRMQKLILLCASGELSPARRSELERHLAGCPACRQYGDCAADVTRRAREELASPLPGGQVMAAIRAEARKRTPAGRVILLRQPVAAALACAACLALVLGAWLHFTDGGPDSRTGGTRAIVALVCTDVLEQQDAGDVEAEDEALHALARDLLIMEGLSVEDAADMEMLWDSSTEDAEPSSTGIRDRNTPELPAKGYV